MVMIVKNVLIIFKHNTSMEAFERFSLFFYGIGVAVYAFEGIRMVLPLESETKDKRNLGESWDCPWLSLLFYMEHLELFFFFHLNDKCGNVEPMDYKFPFFLSMLHVQGSF